MSRALTELQAHALGAVAADRWATTPAGLARDLLCSPSSARSALAALERRGYVSAVYTGHRGSGRGYEVTSAGKATLEAFFGDDAEVEVCLAKPEEA